MTMCWPRLMDTIVQQAAMMGTSLMVRSERSLWLITMLSRTTTIDETPKRDLQPERYSQSPAHADPSVFVKLPDPRALPR